MPKHAAAARENDDLKWDEPPAPEEIERRRRLLAEIRALRSHPLTEEEEDFWQEFDEEVVLEKSRGRGPWPPVDAPVTPEEMEQRKRFAELLLSHMDRPVTEYEEKLWQELKAELERERPPFRS